MEPNISLSFMLPVSQAERVLAFVKSLNSNELGSSARIEGLSTTNENGESPNGIDAAMHFEPTCRRLLRDLLDQGLKQVVRFIVQKNGKFYNDELATELGVDDPRTSTPLGHLTRKLRKTGVSAEGFRGKNWYSTVRSSGRTLIVVRPDVLVILAEALEG